MITALIYSNDDLDVATRTLAGEADNQPLIGQHGVVWVIRTRATWHPPAWWGHTIAQVCEKPYQFSCQLPGTKDHTRIISMLPWSAHYLKLEEVCRAVFDGKVEDPTGGATHYKVRGTVAEWDKAIVHLNAQPVSLGQHDFYRLGPEA